MASSPGALSMLQTPSSFGQSNQTVPGGNQNVSPLSSSIFNTMGATSPTTATLPQYPGMNLNIPGGVTGGASSSQFIPGIGTGAVTPAAGAVGTVPTGTGTGTTPSGGAAGGFNPGTGAINPNASTSTAGSFTMLGDFQQSYGRGTGTALANTLGSLGTSTSMAEQLMLQPTEMAAQASLANAQAQEAAGGVSADSSTAALMAAGLGGQVSANVAGEMGQIGLKEENTLIGALQSEGTKHGSDVSGWQTFGNVMGDIGNAALGLGEAYLTGGGDISGITNLFKGGSDAASTDAAIQQTDFGSFSSMG